MAYYLLIERKFDRVILKKIEDSNDETVDQLYEIICGSDIPIVVATDEARVMASNDGDVRIAI